MTDAIHELDLVALLKDSSQAGLQAGQVGTVVYVHSPDAFEVEFILRPRRSVVQTLGSADVLKLRGLGVPADVSQS